jgi:hypothetical protein
MRNIHDCYAHLLQLAHDEHVVMTLVCFVSDVVNNSKQNRPVAAGTQFEDSLTWTKINNSN